MVALAHPNELDIKVWIPKGDGTFLLATVTRVLVDEGTKPFKSPWRRDGGGSYGPFSPSKRETVITLTCSDLKVSDGVHAEPYYGTSQRPPSTCPACRTKSWTTEDGKCVNCGSPK